MNYFDMISYLNSASEHYLIPRQLAAGSSSSSSSAPLCKEETSGTSSSAPLCAEETADASFSRRFESHAKMLMYSDSS